VEDALNNDRRVHGCTLETLPLRITRRERIIRQSLKGDAMFLRLFAALAVLGLSACASTRGSDATISHLAHLKRQATQTFDLKLGPVRLAVARWFLGKGDDPDAAALRETLKACKAVHVRHYEFGADAEYPLADIEAIRTQLVGRGWDQMVTVRDRKARENTDVYVRFDHDKITGLFVLNSEPRELTIVNIAGSLDPLQIDKLRTQFSFRARGGPNLSNVQRTSIVTPANTP
jgi:hypothetical protein